MTAQWRRLRTRNHFGTWVNAALIAERGGSESIVQELREHGVWITCFTQRPPLGPDHRPAWRSHVQPIHADCRLTDGSVYTTSQIWDANEFSHRLIVSREATVMLDEPFGPVLSFNSFG